MVVWILDNIIHWTNQYAVDTVSVEDANHTIHWIVLYPADTALSTFRTTQVWLFNMQFLLTMLYVVKQKADENKKNH